MQGWKNTLIQARTALQRDRAKVLGTSSADNGRTTRILNSQRKGDTVYTS